MFLRFITVLILVGGVAPPIIPVSGLAMDRGRLQLMKDALSWMTFRREGKLATAMDVEQALLPHLINRYNNSRTRFYRAFVIAFQNGVLPKMTLNEGDACKPIDHVWKNRSPHNNSITWYAIRSFTFESYRNRDDASLRFCDYRQGLVCNPRTSKCGCREGSSMSPVEPGSSIRRCLLNKNEYCALIDFDQGTGPSGFNARILTEMVFNPMKPEGCKPGLQCRLTKTEPNAPRCYDSSTGNWRYQKGDNSQDVLKIGQECSVDIIGSQGSCEDLEVDIRNGFLGLTPGLVCYNLGPPRSHPNWKDVTVGRVGYCSPELGPWQFRMQGGGSVPIIWLRLWSHNFVMGFVHRRTVPLDRDQLEAYYRRYVEEVQDYVFKSDAEPSKAQLVYQKGEPCNVVKTEKMADIWKFYAGLEKDPPRGQDFIATATKQNLDDKLQELVDLVKMNDGKICKVYWSYFVEKPDKNDPWDPNGRFDPPKHLPPLKCVKKGTPTGNNDGICEVLKDDSTKPFSEKVQELHNYAWNAWLDTNYNRSIFSSHPEFSCVLKYGVSKRSLESLEDGSCPGNNSVCMLNLDDNLKIYEQDCKLKENVQMRYDCQDINATGNTGYCEEDQLNKEISEQVKKMSTLAALGKGKVCRHKWEKEIRDGLANFQEWNGNKLYILANLTHENALEPGNFCDRRRLLECTVKDRCDCVKGTAPRKLTVDGVKYESDYCYLTNGPCNGLLNLLNGLTLTQGEIDAINKHYGTSNGECSEGNTCVFVDRETKSCTTKETGSTGHDLKPRPKPPPPPGPLPPLKPYGGGAEGIYGREITGIVMLMLTILTGGPEILDYDFI